MISNPYHNLTIAQTLKELETSEKGLSEKEVIQRRAEFGSNALPREKVLSRFSIFLEQFKSPLLYILFVAGIISIFLGELVDSVIIFIAVFVNVIIGFLQEDKASRALSHLKKLVERRTVVLRDGKEHEIDAKEIVPGDIVIIEEGSRIPADGRLIKAMDLQVNEASLTGESMPIEKIISPIEQGTVLAERKNMVYMGTLATRGRGIFVVTKTGTKSHFGEIASLVKETIEEISPLQARIKRFSKILGILILAFSATLFSLGIFFGREPVEMFLTSVAVAVASIPEGLPISITIILAIGVQKMSGRKALIRKMAAAETLGSVSVICTDKTGTLTLGEMRAEELVGLDGDIFEPKNEEKYRHILEKSMQISLLCNNATIENPKDKLKDWNIIGDSTERALLLKAYELGFDKDSLEKIHLRTDEIPFNSERKFMATLNGKEGSRQVFVKGAPEIVFKNCTKILRDGDASEFKAGEKELLFKKLEEMTSFGLRVIALAYKQTDANKLTEKNSLEELIFTALIALKDPLRPTTRDTIELTKSAGIRPIIVTGDHILTAKAIGAEIGLRINPENIMEGKEVDKMTDAELKERVADIDIYARVMPKHKLRIVDAWQKRGEVVAMTGDGVNDAPAIKSADIGIALGSGSDVTKETSDMVLLDDNFKTIVNAIERGRIIFDNIRKVITYLLADSFTEVVLVAGALLLGLPLPITAAQILYVNFVNDGLPNLALAFDKGERDILKQKPRKRKTPILNNEMKVIIFLVGILTDILLFGVFYFVWKTSGSVEYARTLTFLGLGLDSLFIVYACRSLRHSIWHVNFWSNQLLNLSVLSGAVMLLGVVYIPFLQNVFKIVSIGVMEWGLLLAIGFLNLFFIELVKYIFIHRHRTG